MDTLTGPERSALMSRIRGNDLGPEKRVEAAMLSNRWVYERNVAGLPGSPDFVLRRRRVAVFVHGCFWHGCPFHMRMPKTRRAFWRRKFDANRRRDARTARSLRRMGWSVVTIWEHNTRDERRLPTLLRRRIDLARTRRPRRPR